MGVVRLAVWRRMDVEGVGVADVAAHASGHRVTGYEATAHGGLGFTVTLDAAWRTLAVDLRTTGRGGQYARRLTADGLGAWTVDGLPAAGLDGCVDVDIYCVPITNTFPIRRLGLMPGEHSEITAVWVGVPALDLEVSRQTYRRLDDRDGAASYEFTAAAVPRAWRLRVDGDGLVLDYEDFATMLDGPLRPA